MNTTSPTSEMELFAETLPLYLARAVIDLDRFLNCEGEQKERARLSCLLHLHCYKKNPVAFYLHASHAFLLEHKTTLYPGCLFLYLYRLTISKCPYTAVANVNKIIEVLENANAAN